MHTIYVHTTFLIFLVFHSGYIIEALHKVECCHRYTGIRLLEILISSVVSYARVSFRDVTYSTCLISICLVV